MDKNAVNDNPVIRVRSLFEVLTWVDAAYTIYGNTISHTGGVMPMGYGIIHGKAPKQKINVNSSVQA